jgi:hypothetical protein
LFIQGTPADDVAVKRDERLQIRGPEPQTASNLDSGDKCAGGAKPVNVSAANAEQRRGLHI